MLTEDQGLQLVAYARGCIGAVLGAPPTLVPKGSWCEHAAATFVTLHRKGHLHGCMGSIEPRRPMLEDVAQNAVAAAFRDPRASQLELYQVHTLTVEVTLLGPLELLEVTCEAEALAALRPGVDGVVVRCRGRQATFLPQVWSSLPEPRRFLGELRQKAGLARDFWSDELRLFRYGHQEWREDGAGDSMPPL